MSNRRKKTLVIGAQNIDVYSQPDKPYVLHDSNPTKIHVAFGGVGGNIATNITNLGCRISFLTAFGNDFFGKLAIDKYVNLPIEFKESVMSTTYPNSIYMGIMDDQNDLYLGLNDMDLSKELSVEFMKSKASYIDSFEVLIIDNNLKEDVITYLLETYQDKIIGMDAVSAAKVSKLADHLNKINILKVNTLELSTLSNKETVDDQINDCLTRGLEEILVTDGKNKIIYQSHKERVETMPVVLDHIVNSSGAGDAFFSGFMHGVIHNEDVNVKLNYAKNLAYLTLKSPNSTTDEVL